MKVDTKWENTNVAIAMHRFLGMYELFALLCAASEVKDTKQLATALLAVSGERL